MIVAIMVEALSVMRSGRRRRRGSKKSATADYGARLSADLLSFVSAEKTRSRYRIYFRFPF